MKISIITVVLNNAEYIEECIKSVLDQTYKNIEYIVVDGGSTDGTVEIIKKYENKIAKWISEPDRGIYDAMNKGIQLASGDVVGILNSDDVYYDESVLQCIAKVMENQSVDACYSDLVYVDRGDLQKIVRYWKSCDFRYELLKKGWIPPHPTFYVRKYVYNKYGFFDTSYRLAADYELMVRFLTFYKINVRYIPIVAVKMRLGGVTSKSIRNIVKQNVEILRACRKNKIKVLPLQFFANKFFYRLKQLY